MKKSIACIVAAGTIAFAPLGARAADAGDIAPVRKAVTALIAHDKATVVTQFTSDATVLDEFPVFTFGSPAAWVDGFVQATTSASHVKAVLGASKFNYVHGTSAYAVVPATITAQIGGVPYSENGAFAATLLNTNGSWKISSLAWAKEDEHGLPPIPKMPQAVEDAVRRALDGVNENDMAQTNAQYEVNATFIDEFPQFSWMGTNALDHYNVAFAKTLADYKITNVKQNPGTIRFNYDDGPRVGKGKNAYIVVPLTITANVNGKPYRETGHQAYGLKQVNGAWKIAFQAWVKESENFNPFK